MVVEQFVRRETAVIYGGPYIWPTLAPLGKERLALVGNALPPGPAFVGGTLFVVWNHSLKVNEAVELARHLTSPLVQPDYTGLISLLPVCRETWELPPYSTEPRYRVFREALLQGRSLARISLWGIIESRLTHALSDAWMESLRNPGKSASDLVDELFVPLVERLNLTLSSLPGK
jgi:ABC-type glycerol-3-phosphate transport system substrate-binding protein